VLDVARFERQPIEIGNAPGRVNDQIAIGGNGGTARVPNHSKAFGMFFDGIDLHAGSHVDSDRAAK
jgi:hypothetical protein